MKLTAGVKSTLTFLYSESSTLPVSKKVSISRLPASGRSFQNEPEWPSSESTTWRPFGRKGSISRVAFTAGVETSSVPPIMRVSTFDVRMWLYCASSRLAGHASASRPPPQAKSLPGSPMAEPRLWLSEAKYSLAAWSSAEPMAAYSPQTCIFGNMSSAISDDSQKPLASPLAADRQASRMTGAANGEALLVDSIRPKKLATRTFPSLIGRPSQRSGMCLAVYRIDAARSPVVPLREASL